MAQIFGSLGIPDSDLIFTDTQGQQVIWTETMRLFEQWNTDMEAAMSLFVGETTENFAERYYLPGGGVSQDVDEQMAGETAATKPTGQWDVAYPLQEIGDSLAFNEVGIRYVSMGRYAATVQSIINRNNNTTFYKILRAIFKNTNTAFTDIIHGAQTAKPLANQDGTLYPPEYGATAEAEQNFYLAPGYLESGISDTNNPFLLLKQTLEPIFGFPEGGSPIVAFCNGTAIPYAAALAGYSEFTNRYLIPGDNVTTLTGLPSLPGGMRIVGVDSVSGAVIVEWPRIPSGWIIGLHDDAPKPLKRRRDRSETNLLPGLQLWSQTADTEPFRTARWRNRQGFGVANRLGAVAIALNGTASYTIPSAFA